MRILAATGIMGIVEEWLKEMVATILANSFVNDVNSALSGISSLLFKSITEVSGTPTDQFNGTVNTFLQAVIENALVPIGGIILAYAVIYDFITAIVDKNNMKEFDTSIFLRFILKTSLGIYFLSHSWDISMAIFDIGSWVVEKAGNTAYMQQMDVLSFDVKSAADQLVEQYKNKQITLFGLFQICQYSKILWLSTLFLELSMKIVLWGRMIEIFVYCSVSPIPFATLTNRDLSDIGKNYIKALFALALQGFFIIACIVIYSAISSDALIAISNGVSSGSINIITNMLTATGTGLILCFTLFKTGNISKSILNAH